MVLSNMLRRLTGDAGSRFIARIKPVITRINDLETAMRTRSDDELRALTPAYRERLAAGAKLDDLLPEAFAAVREAARRVLGQRHYDVQLIGGMVLHAGKIAEMKTGEGKTLVAALPCYLNALVGRGVHVVTVNEYLARRDAGLIGNVHRFLGLNAEVIGSGMTPVEKRAAYAADITYGTNNEFGFDYLRDNLVLIPEAAVQRQRFYAVIDEVDSVLVDEARTPLIISGPAEDRAELYLIADAAVCGLNSTHYDHDEKAKSVSFTDFGSEEVERRLRAAGVLNGDLYDGDNPVLLHHLNQSLRAHVGFRRDRDYIVRNEKVVIIDEFTGRMMEGRRYSEGLHQALEAKEGVPILPENRTLASITFQNYFRLYERLSGMTGTAATEASEFSSTYALETVVVPTNRPIVRADDEDEIYRTEKGKITAVVTEIKAAHERGQPVLAGTASVEKSEALSTELRTAGVPHSVLNARFHEREAEIIAQAGRYGAVTIATNMAGRGTDIQLGGNAEMRMLAEAPEDADDAARVALARQITAEIAEERERVTAAGGLYVVGTERHESRRIDNQLRGRAGRQGDPGRSKFFLSLQDDLMRIFATDKIDGMLGRLGMTDDEAITHPWVSRAVRKAQQRVEEHNYEIRRQLLKYDDILNEQRRYVFALRRRLLSAAEPESEIDELLRVFLDESVTQFYPENTYGEQVDIDGLRNHLWRVLGTVPDDLPQMVSAGDGRAFRSAIGEFYAGHRRQLFLDVPADVREPHARSMLLHTLDTLWQQHIAAVEALMHSVGLRGYGQKDPLNEFRIESFRMFESMLRVFGMESLRSAALPRLVQLSETDSEDVPSEADEEERKPAYPVLPESRNATCPCGSGLRYKHCCGLLS